MKHHQTYIRRFGSIEDARSCATVLPMVQRRILSLGHPATVHFGEADQVWQQRQREA